VREEEGRRGKMLTVRMAMEGSATGMTRGERNKNKNKNQDL